MGKMEQIAEGRNQGLVYALKICQEARQRSDDPIQALDKEIKYRGLSKLSICATEKELDAASDWMKATIMKTMLAASMIVLWERFGFGKIRQKRFSDGFNTYASALAEGSITWYDITDLLKEKTDIDIDLSNEDIRGKGEIRHDK